MKIYKIEILKGAPEYFENKKDADTYALSYAGQFSDIPEVVEVEVELIKGSDLTEEQKAMLTFNGMKSPEFVKNHSFYMLENGKPAIGKYPVCHSLSHLPE